MLPKKILKVTRENRFKQAAHIKGNQTRKK
jgi:translation initiation factor IF-1